MTAFSVSLLPHPDAPASGILELRVEGRREAALLTLSYHLRGALESFSFPTPENPAPSDRLWTRSCFELFRANPELPDAYCEYNFSPSGQWAGYAFSAYRVPARTSRAEDLSAPPIWQFSPDSLSCSVRLFLPPSARFRLGLSAILEQKDGAMCHFALRHPPGAPDFHHPSCFALELPRP